jgi:hypothetical protein
VNLAALVLVVLALVTADSSADVVFFPSPALFAGLIMFAAGALLAVATAVYTVYALITRRGPVRSRVGLAYVSAAAFAFALVLNYYNMVGVRW